MEHLRPQYDELAKTLVTPERFFTQEQPTVEFDSREVARLAIEAEISEAVQREKQRILDQRQEYKGE